MERLVRRLRRLLAAALLALVIVPAGASGVAAQGACELSVAPASGPAGTEFTLSGSGYTPDLLTLQREGQQAAQFDLDLGDADPFEIPIRSRAGDEGEWQATVAVTDTECAGTATFRVTLHDTDTIETLLASPAGGLPPIAYLIVVLGGFAGGLVIARRVRSRPNIGS